MKKIKKAISLNTSIVLGSRKDCLRVIEEIRSSTDLIMLQTGIINICGNPITTLRYDQVVDLCNLYDPHMLWRAIIYRTLFMNFVNDLSGCVEYLISNSEPYAKRIEELNARLEGRNLLIIFNNFNNKWNIEADWVYNIKGEILRGLLKNLLYLECFSNIHGKVFLDPGALDDPNVTAFVDSSKLLANKVILEEEP